RSSLCAKPHDQHHGRPILQNLTHTTWFGQACGPCRQMAAIRGQPRFVHPLALISGEPIFGRNDR
ncbi:hypothetical protein, partial [Mesorhizobium sp. LSJC285A00]|uniref:hypothetical protein n=1 Tax=Mesorhizobium sp. LSJC285A00 TaxID=1287338 RepID=UPI001AEC181F